MKYKLVFLTNSELILDVVLKCKERENFLVCVITRIKKPQGRGLKIPLNPIKTFCAAHQIECYEVSSINDSGEILEGTDILVLYDFGEIISKNILQIPKMFTLNIHPSLLPRYRGASPIQAAILNGDSFSGFTIAALSEKVDSGDIYFQQIIPIFEFDDFFTLRKRIHECLNEVFVDILEEICLGKLKPIPQSKEGIKKAPKINKSEGIINFSEEAEIIYRKVMAYKKWPTVYFLNTKRKKIELVSANIIYQNSTAKISQIVGINSFGIYVQTKKYILQLIKLKPEGKSAMPALDYANGERLKIGDFLATID